MAKEKAKRYTIRGKVVNCWLQKASEEYNSFSAKLRVPADQAEALVAKIDALMGISKTEALKETGKKKVKEGTRPYEEADDETGDIIFKFNKKASGVDKKTGEK